MGLNKAEVNVHSERSMNDEKLKFETYLKAANLHDRHANYEVARRYEFGLGTTINLELAFVYYEKTAAYGHIRSMFDLARCLKNGVGVDSSVREAAAIYYYIGIEKEHPAGLLNLSDLYTKSADMPRDYILAYALCNYAAATGNTSIYANADATERLDALEAKMSSSNVIDAQSTTKKWLVDINELKSALPDWIFEPPAFLKLEEFEIGKKQNSEKQARGLNVFGQALRDFLKNRDLETDNLKKAK